ncbi:MAG: lipoprotein-releasing ABC transporter permease subunit [Holosporales bacterium]|jgi:lipoprotein-releasing system permease protein|nr:lipoprotein-releasing ABC transporter permease subunit [Holosporales bacterium]
MMMESFIARRYLHSGKGAGFAYVVSWFSFLGIVLGVATLIIVTSVMNGFRAELLDKIVGMRGHVVVTNAKSPGISDYKIIVDKMKNSIPEITCVVPQIERQVVLMANGDARGVIVHGISKSDLQSKKLISENIKYGSLKSFHEQNVMIGKRMAESLRIKTGDKIKLYLPGGIVTPFGSFPKEDVFEVAGVFEVGMNEYDKNILLMPMETAQPFFGYDNMATQIEIFIESADSVSSVTERLSGLLGDRFLVLDWKHSDASIFHAVVVEKNVMTLILSIIVLVAIFNIISGLTMLTNSKTRDIAILRTMGATRRSILRIFFYIGSSIGIFGTGTGLGLGLLVSLNIDRIKKVLEGMSGSNLFSEEIYYLSQIPSKTDWQEVAGIVAFSLILCLIATLYPAKKASNIDPVEALRR